MAAKPGDLVVLTGLLSRTSLNGTTGRLVSCDADTERWGVHLICNGDPKGLAVKPANLIVRRAWQADEGLLKSEDMFTAVIAQLRLTSPKAVMSVSRACWEAHEALRTELPALFPQIVDQALAAGDVQAARPAVREAMRRVRRNLCLAASRLKEQGYAFAALSSPQRTVRYGGYGVMETTIGGHPDIWQTPLVLEEFWREVGSVTFFDLQNAEHITWWKEQYPSDSKFGHAWFLDPLCVFGTDNARPSFGEDAHDWEADGYGPPAASLEKHKGHFLILAPDEDSGFSNDGGLGVWLPMRGQSLPAVLDPLWTTGYGMHHYGPDGTGQTLMQRLRTVVNVGGLGGLTTENLEIEISNERLVRGGKTHTSLLLLRQKLVEGFMVI